MKSYVYLIGFVISVILAVTGGITFRFLEVEYERHVAAETRAELNELLASKPCLEMHELAWLEHLVGEAESGGIRIRSSSASSDLPAVDNITNWDVQSTIFLALQIIGAVGYGNAPPLTIGGRVFCILYGMVGLPLFVIAAFGIGDLLVDHINKLRARAYNKIKRRDVASLESSAGMAVSLTILLISGLIIFVLIPASIFYAVENWTFGEAVYCCFITVLSIGFADFVPGGDSSAAVRSWYRLSVGVWIMLSLLWFGGIYTAIRELVNYDEIYKPFELGDGEEARKMRMAKQWRKHFDRQWRKLRKRPGHQRLHNPARPSPEAMDARQRLAQLEVMPAFHHNLPTYGPVYSATGDLISGGAGYAADVGGNHVSRIDVRN